MFAFWNVWIVWTIEGIRWWVSAQYTVSLIRLAVMIRIRGQVPDDQLFACEIHLWPIDMPFRSFLSLICVYKLNAVDGLVYFALT